VKALDLATQMDPATQLDLVKNPRVATQMDPATQTDLVKTPLTVKQLDLAKQLDLVTQMDRSVLFPKSLLERLPKAETILLPIQLKLFALSGLELTQLLILQLGLDRPDPKH